jgi:hypothetical protein
MNLPVALTAHLQASMAAPRIVTTYGCSACDKACDNHTGCAKNTTCGRNNTCTAQGARVEQRTNIMGQQDRHVGGRQQAQAPGPPHIPEVDEEMSDADDGACSVEAEAASGSESG